MAAEAYDWGVREQAEELYVLDGRTYREVAAITGVSVATLKRWGKEAGWSENQREHRTALGIIRRKTVQLRKELLEKALGKKDPQNVYAFAALEKAVQPKGTVRINELPRVPVSERRFENTGEMVKALFEAIQQKVNVMISVPGELDAAGIRDVDKAMKLLRQMETEHALKVEDAKQITPEEAQKRREELVQRVDEILGVR